MNKILQTRVSRIKVHMKSLPKKPQASPSTHIMNDDDASNDGSSSASSSVYSIDKVLAYNQRMPHLLKKGGDDSSVDSRCKDTDVKYSLNKFASTHEEEDDYDNS